MPALRGHVLPPQYPSTACASTRQCFPPHPAPLLPTLVLSTSFFPSRPAQMTPTPTLTPPTNTLPLEINSKHTLIHTRPYKCDHPGCDFRAAQERDRDRHKLTHEGAAAIPCAVAGCSKGFTRVDNMKRHVEKKHGWTEREWTSWRMSQ